MRPALSPQVPYQQALKVLNDNVQCDIIKIGGLVRNKERFIKRRDRLLGPNGSTLKAIELLTRCYVLVHGNTVAAMGSFQGIKQVRKIVEDCMRNYHPIYHIKTLMIRRELEKDPSMKHENWDRFLPHFKKRNVQSKKKQKDKGTPVAEGGGNAAEATVDAPQDPAPVPKAKRKKEYTPFPPEQQPRKVDLQIESGEYFLSKAELAERKRTTRTRKQQEVTAKRKQEREARFQPPAKTRKTKEAPGSAETPSLVKLGENVKSKLKRERQA